MKKRVLMGFLAIGVVSLSSGCFGLFRDCFPNVGWRLHDASCRPCAPACSPCGSCPAYRPPMVIGGGPDCPGCAASAGDPMMHQPIGYPPIIGKPMPLPGPGIVPSNELPNPMPVNPKTGQ